MEGPLPATTSLQGHVVCVCCRFGTEDVLPLPATTSLQLRVVCPFGTEDVLPRPATTLLQLRVVCPLGTKDALCVLVCGGAAGEPPWSLVVGFLCGAAVLVACPVFVDEADGPKSHEGQYVVHLAAMCL